MELHDRDTFQERISSVMWRHDVLDRNWFLIYFIENSSARHFCIWKYALNVVEEMFSNGATARNVESGKAGCDHFHYHIYDILRF